MSNSGPKDVSRSRKCEPVGTVPCAERDRLRRVLQKIQQQLDELLTEEFVAFQVNDEARFWRLNRDIAPLHEELARSENALRKHIRTHRCRTPQRTGFVTESPP
jgi:hypothetical protein